MRGSSLLSKEETLARIPVTQPHPLISARAFIFSLSVAFILWWPTEFRAYATTMATAVVDTPSGQCAQEDQPSTASCSGFYYINVLGGNIFELVDGSAFARATYGGLGVSADMAASVFDRVGDEAQGGSAQSNALFFDTALLLGPRFTTGVLALRFTLSGSAGTAINKSDPADQLTGGLGWAMATFLNEGNLTESTGPVTGPITDTFTIPFELTEFDTASGKWSASIPFGLDLNAHADCTAEGEISSSPRAGTCSASALYYDTLQVDALTPVDAKGNVLSDVTLTTGSGTDYNTINTAETPEPPTLLLFGTALAILTGTRLASVKRLGSRG